MTTGGQGTCGHRPTAVWQTVGLRYDLGNRRGGSWIVPFFEGHVGMGGQRVGTICQNASLFPTGGGRIGLDVWLGSAAVTLGVAVDYLPVAPPVTFTLGASFVGM